MTEPRAATPDTPLGTPTPVRLPSSGAAINHPAIDPAHHPQAAIHPAMASAHQAHPTPGHQPAVHQPHTTAPPPRRPTATGPADQADATAGPAHQTHAAACLPHPSQATIDIPHPFQATSRPHQTHPTIGRPYLDATTGQTHQPPATASPPHPSHATVGPAHQAHATTGFPHQAQATTGQAHQAHPTTGPAQAHATAGLPHPSHATTGQSHQAHGTVGLTRQPVIGQASGHGHAARTHQAAARDAAFAAPTTAPLGAPAATGGQPAWTTPAPPADTNRPTRSPAPPDADRPNPIRRLLGEITALRIMCWQLVLIAAVLVVGEPWYVIAAVAVASLLVLALTAVRRRGRWLHEWVMAWSTYLARRRVCELSTDAGPALLRHLSPESTGINATVNGEPVFMVSQPTGLTAVLLPRSTARDLTKAIPPPEDLLPPTDEQALAFAVRVVHHAGVKRDRPPRVWIALQALRTVDAHRDAEVTLALGNAIRRAHRQLRRDGLPTRTLAEPELLGTLAALSHTNSGRGQVQEHWHHWRSGTIRQATFRLTGWADLPPNVAGQLLRWLLTAAPGAAITVAITATRPPDRTDTVVEAALRVATMAVPTLTSATLELTRLARERGITLERLDGRHTTGVAATLPLGAL
ncbi:Outer membrane protein, OmpA/MotB family [Alloactinosynnema sp. L-07]|uniref:type VII secretion protein EccE n=1 Tax=Alloactinosynnema sp. L-07 TaxID=1653480 RepID=UPI00065EF6BF|nr:type VII secretion protein EccE [Alloactinosynnema sp. L-07]CRK58777.1 Outer membrane protein, OmpA/MotB family [Alloactinosynnema sp. L-07]